MKRFLAILVFSLFLLLPSLALAQVESESLIMPPSPQDKPGFLGQNHNYSVVFRGNGEAVVSLKVIFTNTQDKELSQVDLRIPQVESKNLAVYQVIKEAGCGRRGMGSPLSDDLSGCLEIQEPDYYQYWGESKYQKAKFELKADTLQITLPQSIKPNKSGSFFVYFRAFGYAKKNLFGAYRYKFETLQVEDDIESLQIGIDTDSDLILKGVKGEVDYRFEEPALQSFGVAESAPAKSAAIDSFYRQIGGGRIIKTASNLAGLESYQVSGSYAKSRLSLYAKEILIATLVLIIFVVLTFILVRRLLKAGKENKSTVEEITALSPKANAILLTGGLSFASSAINILFIVFAYFVGSQVIPLFGYRFQLMAALMLIFISFCIVGFLLIGPGILVGWKKGLGCGIATVILSLFWLILFFGIVFILFFSLGTSTPPADILPALKGEASPLQVLEKF